MPATITFEGKTQTLPIACQNFYHMRGDINRLYRTGGFRLKVISVLLAITIFVSLTIISGSEPVLVGAGLLLFLSVTLLGTGIEESWVKRLPDALRSRAYPVEYQRYQSFKTMLADAVTADLQKRYGAHIVSDDDFERVMLSAGLYGGIIVLTPQGRRRVDVVYNDDICLLERVQTHTAMRELPVPA